MHQCPKCELRFRSTDELNDHLVRDHRVPPEDLPQRRRAAMSRPPTPGPPAR